MGEPYANENQELLWLEPEKLHSINLLKTNYEIVKIIKQPLIVGISCAELLGTEKFLNVFKKKLRTRAVDVLQIRDKTLNKKEKENLFIHLNSLSKKYNFPIVINDDIELAEKYSIKSIHLSYEKSKTYENNQLFEIFSISYHQGQNMEYIAKLRPKYVQIGPIYETKTHPGRNNIGIENCRNIILKNKKYKFIAVGGIGFKNITQILEAGFNCVASRTKIWNLN
jgi:thiamine-phosphate pyrophosphorylase